MVQTQKKLLDQKGNCWSPRLLRPPFYISIIFHTYNTKTPNTEVF